MSKSYRKPYASIVGAMESNKECKIRANKKFRKHNKQALLKGEDGYYRLQECSDNWDFDSDGLDTYKPEWADEEYYERISRK